MWQKKDNHLYKEFKFQDFKRAFAFMQSVAEEAERRQHHPRWENEWNEVRIWLSTHEQGNKVTEKDIAMADAIDTIYDQAKQKSSGTAPTEEGAHQKIKLFSDGGSRGNPGPSASGYVLLAEDDSVIVKNGVYLGITTNNQAEYQSLKFGLEEAKKLGAREVYVHMDSLLVINQMKGIFKVKNRDLWPIHQSIKDLVKYFDLVTFTHVPREFNKLADAAVNETLDSETGK